MTDFNFMSIFQLKKKILFPLNRKLKEQLGRIYFLKYSFGVVVYYVKVTSVKL